MNRNVVLICLDAVRKDYFDEYARRIHAVGDLSFGQCRAASSWTVPSHGSMLTGELPHRHGVHSYARDFSRIDPRETFLASLSEHTTAGVSANVYTGPEFGFDRFFDRFSSVSPSRRFPDGLDVERFLQEVDSSGVERYLEFLRAVFRHSNPGASLANGVVSKLTGVSRRAPVPKPFDDGATLVSREIRRFVERCEEPFFVYANYMDAHAPLQHVRGYVREFHSAPNAWHSYELDMWDVDSGGRLQNQAADVDRHRGLYAASIDYLDRTISELVEGIRRETDRETTVVVTADHGENLAFPADDYGFEHMISSLTEGLLHVPLEVIDPPPGYDLEDDGYVSQLSLGRLVTGLAHGEVPDVAASRIPAERVGIGTVDAPVSDDVYRYADRTMRCVYEDSRKFVWDSLGTTTEYELDPERPSWQRRRTDGAVVPEWAEEFFTRDIDSFASSLENGSRHGVLSDGTARRLRDLGYL